MPSRQPYWCVVEVKDGKRYPISRAYEYVADTEERKDELLKKEEYRNKNLQVIEASHPVDPRRNLEKPGDGNLGTDGTFSDGLSRRARLIRARGFTTHFHNLTKPAIPRQPLQTARLPPVSFE